MRRELVRSLAVALVLFPFAGCVTLTPEQQQYLQTVSRQPLEFTVSKDQAETAWGRAQSFIGRYSSMKLQIATDYVLQTYNPRNGEVDFGYSVTKTPVANTFQLNVSCNTGNEFSVRDAWKNARILAYYISTGQLPHPELISR